MEHSEKIITPEIQSDKALACMVSEKMPIVSIFWDQKHTGTSHSHRQSGMHILPLKKNLLAILGEQSIP